MKKVSRAKNPSPSPRKVSLKLVGLSGNAFAILSAFRAQAKKERWPEHEIDSVLSDAQSGDYSHLLSVIASRSSCPAG